MVRFQADADLNQIIVAASARRAPVDCELQAATGLKLTSSRDE